MLTPVITTEPKTTITDMPSARGGESPAAPVRRTRWALGALLQLPAATVGLAREAE
jgi:hypothetical protein